MILVLVHWGCMIYEETPRILKIRGSEGMKLSDEKSCKDVDFKGGER